MLQKKGIFDIILSGKYNSVIFFILLLLLSLLTAFSYGTDYFIGDDNFFHIARFETLMLSLREGTFPSYIDYDSFSNYGYLVKPFYPDFILIPFAALGNITSPSFAYTFLLFTMSVLCGVFMYNFVRKVYGSSFVAAVASLLYTFSLYRLLDVYHRAALGEALSFTFVPIVFLGLYYIIAGDYKKWYVIAIGFSLMIMTHLLSSFLLFITVGVFLLIYHKRLLKEPKRIYYLIVAGAVSLVLVSYFIYPFLEQLISDKFYFQKFKMSPYKTGQSSLEISAIFEGMVGGFGFKHVRYQLGALLILPLFLRLFIGKDHKAQLLKHTDNLVIIGIVLILLMSALAPWESRPLAYLSIIQFPWRLQEFISFFFSIAAAYYLYLFIKTKRYRAVAMLILILLTSIVITIDGRHFAAQDPGVRASPSPLQKNGLEVMGMEYVPADTPSAHILVEERGDSIISLHKNTSVTNFKRDAGITRFDVSITGNDELELPLFYYKGYNAKLDGENISVNRSDLGLIKIPVTHSGTVEVRYTGTIIQKVSFYITIISFLLLFLYIWFRNRRLKDISN